MITNGALSARLSSQAPAQAHKAPTHIWSLAHTEDNPEGGFESFPTKNMKQLIAAATLHQTGVSPEKWQRRSSSELIATSQGCWPDGEPVKQEGIFSCQPGVQIHRRGHLSTQQCISSVQREGQSTESVTRVYRERRRLQDLEESKREVVDLKWELKSESLEARVSQIRRESRKSEAF
mmetsp:Transcript_12808/g.17506  ORF Transcript_12808/g.17506 Transcript_12808/m.17506 type:complete len:178 (+) Transcript_12808:174-707(+)